MTAAMGYASALSDVSGVIGQETAAGKAMAVAASLINTYASIAGQIRAFSEVGILILVVEEVVLEQQQLHLKLLALI
jgi:hypothetical protein